MGEETRTKPLLGDEELADQNGDVLKYGSLLVFVLSATLDAVLNRKVSYAAFFPASLAQLTACAGAVVFPSIVFIAYKTGKVKKDSILLEKKDWVIPCLIGFLFGFHHILTNIGAGYGSNAFPGTFMLVLGKFIVPISMVLAIFGGKQHKNLHWCGVIMLFVGIICTVLVPLAKAMSSYNVQMAINMVWVVFGTLPLAFAFALLEKFMKGRLKAIFTPALWMWVCIAQSLITPLLAVIAKLVWVWHHHEPSVVSVSAGMMCYVFGITPSNAPKDTNCLQAAPLWWFSIVSCLCMNLAMPICTRYGGASLMWFVRAMTTPICSLIFSIPSIMGTHALPLSGMQILGIFFVSIAFIFFEYADDPGMLEKLPSGVQEKLEKMKVQECLKCLDKVELIDHCGRCLQRLRAPKQ